MLRRGVVSIFAMICVLLAFCLLAAPAYAWNSVDGGSHRVIIKDAYAILERTGGFNSCNFPNRDSIEGYTGLIWGADAALYAYYEDYFYSNHYCNPSRPGGKAPKRAQYWYDELVKKIKARKAKSKEAAQAAAYLAHYVSDVGSPYHVKGHLITLQSAGSKDWYDKDYIEKAGFVPTGPHVDWEKKALDYTPTKYYGISNQWGECGSATFQVNCFVKKIAARTQKEARNNIQRSSTIERLLGLSAQDVYTVYKAAYDEGTRYLGRSCPTPQRNWLQRRWDSWRR